MKTIYVTPAERISDYVQSILVIENYQGVHPFILPLFANGTPTLLFHTQKGQIKNSSGYLTLFGQTVLPDKLLIEDSFTLIAYYLAPYSLRPLFGVAANEMTNNPTDLNLLCSNSDLQEQLLNATGTIQMLSLLDDYLFGLITKAHHVEPRIKHATKIIALKPGKDVLGAVQKELCLTERSFQRIFERNIGVSPNQFRRVSQFHNAFRQLNKHQFQNLSDLAFDNGYSDQSHYIRTFKEFTHITPTEYLHLRNV
jgi:AraC-like DNA-binding protein